VFIGIQVSNWNDAREDRRVEARYLIALANDIRVDLAELEAVQNNAARNASIWYVILTEGFGVTPESLGQFPLYDRSSLPEYPSDAWKSLFASLFSINRFDPTRQILEMLISTGDNGLLQDHEMVRAFMAY